MEFCLAKIEFWIAVGFNTERWRKSNNGAYALIHKEQAKILVPNCDSNPNIKILKYNSPELEGLLSSSEWKEKEKEKA